jgi:D-lactate dehydrogenase (quinone)
MSNAQLISDLEKIVGARHVLTTPSATRRFRKGFRFGDGPALAVVRPGSLVEMWRSLRACSEAGKIVLMQAANTPISDLQFGVANTEIGVIQAPAPGASNHEIRTH